MRYDHRVDGILAPGVGRRNKTPQYNYHRGDGILTPGLKRNLCTHFTWIDTKYIQDSGILKFTSVGCMDLENQHRLWVYDVTVRSTTDVAV